MKTQKMMNMKGNKAKLLIALIIVLSLALRIYDLGSENLWFDESASVISSRQVMSDIIGGKIGPNPPLYYTILHFWMELFGDSEFSVRFPSVIFGVISIYLIYRLGTIIFDRRIGILSAFIMSIFLYHIRYSQEARPYALLVMTVLLSNYYLIKLLKEKRVRINESNDIYRNTKINENKERRRNIVGYVISSIVMIYSHYYGLFYYVLHRIYYFMRCRNMKNVKLWAAIHSVILLSFILCIPNILNVISKFYVGVLGKFYPTFHFIYGTFELFVGNDKILQIFLVMTIVGIIIGIIFRRDKEDADGYIFVLLWMFVPFIISISITYMIGPVHVYYSRYFIASFPAMILLFSKGAFNFIDINTNRVKTPIITVFVILMILTTVVLQIPLIKGYYQNVDKERWEDVSDYIKDHKKDGDIIVLYPKFGIVPFGYYYKNVSDYIGIDSSADIKNIKNIKNDRVWLVSSHMYYKERKRELLSIEKELSKRYTKISTTEFADVPTRTVRVVLMVNKTEKY